MFLHSGSTARQMNRHRRIIPIGFQVYVMKVVNSTFMYSRRRNGKRRIPTWTGVLQPSVNSPRYRVMITYTPPRSPRVFILDPELRPNAPHRYSDGSLCLYYPNDQSWTPSAYIAGTILPWTSVWLKCYELWCITGKWYGLEAPHRRRKR